MTQPPRWWVLDIETIVDEELLGRVEGISLASYRDRLAEQLGVEDPWIPTVYHRPVAIGVAFLNVNLGLERLVALPAEEPEELARLFWSGWESYGRPTLVTWNGRGFDLPVLEQEAFRAGLDGRGWFRYGAKSWEDPRNRYNAAGHLDLMDELGNRGAGRRHGGLNLAAKIAGYPGKLAHDGGDVAGMVARGEMDLVRGYCLADVLNTFGVFLRWARLVGWEMEEASIGYSRDTILDVAKEHPATVGAWLQAFEEVPS